MAKQLLTFLTELADNNNKEWMDSHRSWYLEVREYFLTEVNELLKGLVAIEPGLETLSAKDCVFRQNRDIRFSPDKRPYKTNFAAYFAVGGKKSAGPGYYVHVQPGASFLAGGIWMPPADVLKRIRQEIDYSGKELDDILKASVFKKHFQVMNGEKLKTSPRDYPADHPYIDYLRFKSFEISKPLSDDQVNNGTYKEDALKAFKALKPFNDFLARALDDVEDGSGIL